VDDQFGDPFPLRTKGLKGNILEKIFFLKYQHTGILDHKVPKWVEDFWYHGKSKFLNCDVEPDCLKYFGATDNDIRKNYSGFYHIYRCAKSYSITDKSLTIQCYCDIPELCNMAWNDTSMLKMHRKRFSNGAKAKKI
jgi:hypothetical protein